MDNDDQQLGRILSRRELLTLFGVGAVTLAGCAAPSTGTTASGSASTAASSAAASATGSASATASQALTGEAAEAASPATQATFEAEVQTAEAANTQVATPNCVVRPEVTEGPYYVDVDLVRTDVREDKEGTPLTLTFNVSEVSDAVCAPFEGVTVEIWHCDATGAYSGVSDPGFDTSGQTWLRGAQVTDANGVATFTSIFPGWYASRAVHIHFKVLPNENQVFTSQLFFDDTFIDNVFGVAPYASEGERDTFNDTDTIYQDLLLLDATQNSDGVSATFALGVDLSTVGTDTGGGGPGGGTPPSGGPGGSPPAGGPGGSPSGSATTTP